MRPKDEVLQVIVLFMFVMTHCSPGVAMTEEWVPSVARTLVVLEVMRCSGAMFAVVIVALHEDGLLKTSVNEVLRIVCLCIGIVMVGLYLAIASVPSFRHGQDECAECLNSWITGMGFLNIGLCLLNACDLLADKAQAEAASSNLEVTVNPLVLPDPSERLAHLTLQTFTMGTQSSATNQIRECVICLNGPYCPGEVVTELRCHHTFHSFCIASWVHNGGLGCPMRCEPATMSANEAVVEAGV